MAADPNAAATLATGALSTLPVDPSIAALATSALPATVPVNATGLNTVTTTPVVDANAAAALAA